MFFVNLPGRFQWFPTVSNGIVTSVAHRWLLLALVLFAGLLCARNPVKVGGDEGMEMSKALLLAHQPAAAPTVWNDQPWLYSQVLALTWQWSNGSWVPGRWLSLLALALLIAAIWKIQGPQETSFAKGTALLALILWSPVFRLACSMMLELPAFAFVTFGASVLIRTSRLTRWPWILGGAMIGLGIGIKLTALLYIPAILAALLAGSATNPRGETSNEKSHRKVPGTELLWMALGAVTIFAGTALLSPNWDWGTLWQSHWTATQMMPEDARDGRRFNPELLLSHPAILLAAAVGVMALLKRGSRCQVLFSLTALIVTTLVHLWHRPFWPYYLLHFGIPLAVLAGPGLDWAYRRVTDALSRAPIAWSARKQAAFMLYLGIPALLVSFEVPALFTFLNQLGHAQTAEENQIVKVLRHHRDDIDSGYASDSALLSHAGIPPEPEWTVLPLKRYWTNAITKEEVTKLVETKRPEAIILSKSIKKENKRWKTMLEADYVRAATGRGSVLYLSDRLEVAPVPGTKQMLEQFGL